MGDKELIGKKYRHKLPDLVLANYTIIMPILIFILLSFCFTDFYIREIPALIYTRIAPILLSIMLFGIKFTKLKNNYNAVLLLNNLLVISIILMGYFIVSIGFYIDLFKSAITAFIMCLFLAFFLVKGRSSIFIVFSIPLLFILIDLIFFIKPDLKKTQELMNPTAVYFGVIVLSYIVEKSRFNEFFLKESLLLEVDKTVQQNNELQLQKEEILSINEQLEQRKEELQINLEVISDLNKQLNKKNKAIFDSINYARRIQETILPTHESLSNVLLDYFILYKPCNIVSGDFYWLHSTDTFEIIAAVDCTGHGVPGGFMSMLSYSLLNDVVQNSEIATASEILNKLKLKLKASLNQGNEQTYQNDGLDIALCLINKKRKTIQFSGAYMPVTVIRNNQLIHYKGDKMPIGRYLKEIPSFTNHEITIQEGDNYYLYSDGFQDQIGGIDNKRFLSKNLKNLLLEMNDLPFSKQKQKLEESFEEWKGINDQIDDVMILGFKL